MEEMEKNVKKAMTQRESGRKSFAGTLGAAVRYGVHGVGAVARAFDSVYNAGEENGSKVKKTVLGILLFSSVLLFSAAVALARFPLDVYPAGFALLSALRRQEGGGKRKQAERTVETALILTVFAGVLISTAFLPSGGFFYLLAYLIFFLCRAGFSGGRMNESRLFRVTFSAFFSVGLGILLAALSGFPIRNLFAVVSVGIITPVFSYLLCGFYMEFSSGGVGLSAKRRVYAQGAFCTLA